MTALTAGEKALLRATGHKAQLSLWVNTPSSYLAAVVTGSPATGDRTITYGSGTGSGFSIIGAGNPVWVGSSAGANDKGIVRLRAISGSQSSGTLTLAENPVNWVAGDYITIYGDYPLWPKYPWQGGTPVVWKKDGPDGDTYTNQNSAPPPVAIIGPHRVGALSSGTVRFYLDATLCYAISGTVAGVHWYCTGGTINNATAAQTYIDFTTAGQYWLSIVVTGSNGATQNSYRRIWVDDGTLAYKDVIIDRFEGDWDRGGWTVSMTVYGLATGATFPDRTLIVLTQDSVYGSNTQLIGGYKVNSADARNIVFAGYIRGETVIYNWNVGSVSFEAASIDAMLGRHQMFSVALQQFAGVTPNWWMYLNPTIADCLHHLWKWHSNLFDIADVYLPTANTLKMQIVEIERGSLYSMADTLAYQYGIKAHVCSTKWGELHVETDLQLQTASQRAAATVVSDLTAADCREEMTIVRNPEARTALVNLSGFSYDGAKVTAIVSKAPGSAPGDIGPNTIDDERQVLDTQAQANALAGRVYAQANNLYPEARAKFAGNYLGALELVPQEWWTLTLTGTDNPRGISGTFKLIPRNISAQYNPQAGSLIVDAAFEPEAAGVDGVTGDYPTTPPGDAPDPGPPSQPAPITPPPRGALAAFCSVYGHFWRLVAGGAFAARNGGLTGAGIQDTAGRTDPFWWTAGKQNTSDPERSILWKCDVGKVYRSIDGGQTWQDRTPVTDPPNYAGDATAPTAATVAYKRLASSGSTDKLHYLLAEFQGNASAWRGWIARTPDDGLTWAWHALGYAAVSQSWAFAADVESWVFVPSEGVHTWTGAWTGATGHTAAGCLTCYYTKTSAEGISANWKYTPAVSWVAATGDTASVWVKTAAGNHATSIYLDIFYKDGSYDHAEIANPGTTWHEITTTVDAANNLKQVDYIRVHVLSGTGVGAGTYQWYIDDVAISLTGGGTTVRPLWADVDSAYVWVTVWRTQGTSTLLALYKLALADCSQQAGVELGGCTLAEMEAKTYAAYVFAGTTLYVYGKMAAVPGLTGAQLVASSTDGGATWTSVVDVTAWATGYCGSFADLGGEYIAVRNDSTNKFYKGTGVLTYVADTAFGVNPGSLTVSAAGKIAIGSNAGPNVHESADNGATWTDISSGITAGGVISALTYV